jgi:hypothetical protein
MPIPDNDVHVNKKLNQIELLILLNILATIFIAIF